MSPAFYVVPYLIVAVIAMRYLRLCEWAHAQGDGFCSIFEMNRRQCDCLMWVFYGLIWPVTLVLRVLWLVFVALGLCLLWLVGGMPNLSDLKDDPESAALRPRKEEG